MVSIVKMGRRGDYSMISALFWTVSMLITLGTGGANPEPHPDPASPLTGPGPQSSLPNPRIVVGPKDKYVVRGDPETLNCNAKGDPPPKITWYQNGELIRFENDIDYHRMMLYDGQLFFLRVIHSKVSQPDVGRYYCKASNIHGTVTSEPAEIKIAVLRDDFRQEPVATTKSVHSTAILHCKPPRGEPKPQVSWQHYGRTVTTTDDRIQLQEDGDLVISQLTTQDAGEYVCVAKNKAGEKKSSVAILTVHEIPELTQYPKDATADEGEMVEFHCAFNDDPQVKLSWKKQSGPPANENKWRMLPGGTLRIENVQASDAGVYECTAENEAGSVEAVAHLKVEYTPIFLVRPRDQVVAAGRTVSLQCAAEGNPPPTIIWKTNKQELVFVNQQLRKFSMDEDGTLRIEKIQREDEGDYLCQAINSKGDAQSVATITVRENDFRPPPVIRFGPQNQTLQEDGVALLRCQATGSPQPMIRWLKHGRPLQMIDARYTLLDSGTLQISSLKISDTGRYTCKAVSETGETTLEATLIVGSQSLGPSDPRKTPPDLTMFPGAPEKPSIHDVTNTTVRLSWQQLRNTGMSPVSSYQVEYFAYGVSETWEVVSELYTATDVTVDGLLPNTTYVFLVRAKNTYGTGGPSPLSDLLRTAEKGEYHVPKPQITLPDEQVEKRLKKVDVKLMKVETINASAIRISWLVKDEMGAVDSFIVQYSHIYHMGDRHKQRYGLPQKRRVPYRPLSYTITGLSSYEYYEICVMASCRDMVSTCSQPWKIQSGESVPTSPPDDVQIQRLDDTSVLVSWSPPSIENRKGEITGYQIKCFSEDGTQNCSKSTNGTMDSVLIDGLVAGVNYHISMAAQTEKGFGKWSSNFSVGGPEEADITKKPWFIGTIIAIGCMFWIALCLLVIWLCVGKRRPKKLKEQWLGPGQKGQERNGNIVRKGFAKDGTFQDNGDNGLPPEFSTLLSQSQHEGEDQTETGYSTGRDCSHPEMKTFYQTGPVSPYATTTLLQAQAQNNSVKKPGNEQMFRPIQGYHHNSGGSGDSNTDRSNTTDVSIEAREPTAPSTGDSGHMTDENGHLLKQHRKGCRVGGPQNQPMVNWSEVLPPPPSHPPSDGEFLVDDQLYSEIPEERAKSPLSPMSQMSACSCPVSHPLPAGYNNMGLYTDNCNRCQSLRNFDNRPYSPQQLMQLQRQHGYPPNMPRGMGGQLQHPGTQRGGTPVYLHGYSQPWDCQPLPRGPFEFDPAHLPQDGYNYTQPIQDGLIEHSNTLRIRDKNKNFQYPRGPHIGDMNDMGGAYPGMLRDMSNTPGGPPGNYCEGPCKGQIEAMNIYNKSISDAGQPIPNLEGYRIDSPPSSGSEYKVVGGMGNQSESAVDSGSYNGHPVLQGRSSIEGNDLKDRQFHTLPEGKCRPNMFHTSRSKSSAPGQVMLDEGFSRNADSPVSEDPDYAEGSEHGGDQHPNERDSMVANWESMEDCSSVHSSSSNVSEGGQFLTEEDFASAVAHAAQMSGLTVVGTTVSDPNPKPVKKSRHRRQARPPSPGYSTDSNYGTADMVHKPYPKSQRRKHLAEQSKSRNKGEHSNTAKGDNSNPTKGDNSNDTNTPEPSTGNVDGEAMKSFNKPEFPSSPSNSSQSKVPSLYRDRAPEGSTTPQEVQKNGGNTLPKRGIFQFSEDIPVV